MLWLILCVLASCAPMPATAPSAGAAPGLTPQALAMLNTLRVSTGRMPEVNTVYRDRITLAGRILPLPPGDWLATKIDYSVGPGPGFSGGVFLIRRTGPTLSGTLQLIASAIGHRLKTVEPVGPCAATDVLVSEIRGTPSSDAQDCLSVLFYQQSIARTLFKANWDAVDRLNLIVPPTFVAGSFRIVTPDSYVIGDYTTNPDLDGIPVDAEPNRALNRWSRDRLARDPARKGYVDRLRTLMDRYRAELIEALGQTQPVPADDKPGLPGGGPRKLET